MRVALLAGATALVAACGSGDDPVTDAATDGDAASNGADAADSGDAITAADAAPPDAFSPCPSDMAYVPTSSVCIDRFEASHAMGNIAMSNPGVFPWANVTWDLAQTGCDNAGKRLCTEAEWEAACVGPAPGTTYPYGSVYGSHTCNGADHGVGAAVRTGSMTGCEGGFPGIFDMSGNVYEWTSSCTTTCTMRGGSYSIGGDFTSLVCTGATAVATTMAEPYIGFRCCLTPD